MSAQSTFAGPITQLLRRSIEEQIETTIFSSPECSRSASIKVDQLLVRSERIGGQR